MNSRDLKWCIRRLPKDLKTVMMTIGPQVSIGGGYIRSCISGDEIVDIDLFVESNTIRDKVVEILKPKTKEVFRSKNAITILGYKYPIQIIHRWLYAKPEDILSDFDFSVACAVMWCDKIPENLMSVKGEFEGWHGRVHEYYYQDLAAKRLRYLSPDRDEDVGGSVLRVLKYYRKGYNIDLESYAGTICRLVSKVDHRNVQGSEQLKTIITGLLVEVDPNAIVGEEIVR